MMTTMDVKMRALLLLLLLSATTTAAKEQQQQCHDDDEAALLAIDAALGSPYHFASWTRDTSCCDWYDVDCDQDSGRVVSLSVFQDANLTGAIPDAIANLTHLRTLVLHHLPQLSGAIPDSLAALTSLSQLTISWTAVSGPVPTFLAELTSLTLLDLSFNSLTGAIPASLGALTNLSGINLSRNRLAGPIPAGLFANLDPQQEAYLRLSHNNLSGSVPADLAAANLALVDLSRNALTGDATALFRQGRYVDLSRNSFVFNMSGVEFAEETYYVDVSHNGIRGGIPAQVANLTNLQMFNVSYNKMCGAVPAGGNMARFDAYCFQHNKCLCGAPLATACRR
ncbi:hypothetical protein E2562_008484 [Oryza meyeriana var. granulata]|uniref:Leucine-rich repeat-containing N-terminal plant-type domain-containing protein n=1 Tax=Oryza meyeriana var. granulata TaxID=110450 RepID=A0A6G1EHW9_9ORYZ|nr:hypothetical protein E2562_008484 [Oryza meyeriana var. granulata]